MKGWTGLLTLVLATVLTVSGLIFGGVEYYRAHPFETDEIQNFYNIITAISLPFWGYLVFRYLKIRISEREWGLEYQKKAYEFGNFSVFGTGSPTEKLQKSEADPLPTPSLNAGIRGGVLIRIQEISPEQGRPLQTSSML